MGAWQDRVGFIKKIADRLRGPYKPNQYGKVVLPMTVLRRLDCVLAATRDDVTEAAKKVVGRPDEVRDKVLKKAAGLDFYNESELDFPRLLATPDDLDKNLAFYISRFSPEVRQFFDRFDFAEQIDKLSEANRLYEIVQEFGRVDLHPERVPHQDMGLIFEELVRKFSEDANETAGDHFTPREVIRLLVSILFAPDDELLSRPNIVRTIYDPTCGTGGMLSAAADYILEHNNAARPQMFGQDYNPESYAICGSDMLIKGQDFSRIIFGDVLGDGKTHDGYGPHATDPDNRNKGFDYLLANPLSGSSGSRRRTPLPVSTRTSASAGGSGLACPALTTARCCSCST